MALSRSYRRLIFLILLLPVTLFVMAFLYMMGMYYLEGIPRTLGASLEWAAETLTTTGYGRDAHWEHPVMEFYVIVSQFSGLIMVFTIFPVFILPFFEERFQGRLATRLPALDGHIVIYRYGPEVASLLEELDLAKVPVLIIEEQEATARRLMDRERRVVFTDVEDEDLDLAPLIGARGLVLNGEDDADASMALSAREAGYDGPIIAMATNPARRRPLLRAGASVAFTPTHVLAAALAARASERINPRVSGVSGLGKHLEVAELRVTKASPLAGKTLAESSIRSRTGAIVVGIWVGDHLERQPSISARLEAGNILVVVGSASSVARLGELATPVARRGTFLILGGGPIGQKVAEFLRDAGETVIVVDPVAAPGVDEVGDPFELEVLTRVGVREAQAVVLTLEGDSATLFAAAVVRDVAPDVLILAGAARVENVKRMHSAGADFALSVGQVAGQLLVFHLLGQRAVALEAEIKLVETAAGNLAGQALETSRIRERTGCSVVAVERKDGVIVDFPKGFELEPDDVVFLCGTSETLAEYFRQFPETRVTREMRVPLADDASLA